MTTGVEGSRSRRGGKSTGRPPTLQDVAEQLGVSRQLLSMVMRGLPAPSAESRDPILAAASELGCRPNASALLLRQQRARLIGAVFGMGNPFTGASPHHVELADGNAYVVDKSGSGPEGQDLLHRIHLGR